MDYDKYLKIIDGLVGKECERTLAVNTLKIRFGEKSPYIWVDPPWQLYRENEFITASAEYTDERFREWSQMLNPLNQTVLEGVEYSVKNGLHLYFSNGYKLIAPTSLDELDEDDFYNHDNDCGHPRIKTNNCGPHIHSKLNVSAQIFLKK